MAFGTNMCLAPLVRQEFGTELRVEGDAERVREVTQRYTEELRNKFTDITFGKIQQASLTVNVRGPQAALGLLHNHLQREHKGFVMDSVRMRRTIE